MVSRKLKILASAFALITFFSNESRAKVIDDYSVCFFKDAYYQGEKTCYSADAKGSRASSFAGVVNYVGKNLNDAFSSVLVGPKVGVFIYTDANGGGLNRTVRASEKYVGDDWNDKISSLQVLVKPEFLDAFAVPFLSPSDPKTTPTIIPDPLGSTIPAKSPPTMPAQKNQQTGRFTFDFHVGNGNGNSPVIARKKFSRPMYQGERLDYCMDGNTGCGQDAADAFCEDKGFDGAVKFKKARGKGVGFDTIQIGTGDANENEPASAFKSITCE